MNAARSRVMKFAAVLAPKLLSLSSKLIKSAKVIKGLLAVGSFASYSLMYSWEFACLLIGSLVIHEYGHLTAMRRLGMKTRGIYLIPFVGGAAVAAEDFPTYYDEFVIAYAGPVYGLLTVVALMFLYLFTGYPLWAGCAAWVAMVNLFNLLPIYPLDGGRIMKSVINSLSSKYSVLVIVISSVAAIMTVGWFGNVALIAFLLLVGIMELAGGWRRADTKEKLTATRRAEAIAIYLALIAAFVMAIDAGRAVPEATAAFNTLLD
jgi:Zn-dependent protease